METEMKKLINHFEAGYDVLERTVGQMEKYMRAHNKMTKRLAQFEEKVNVEELDHWISDMIRKMTIVEGKVEKLGKQLHEVEEKMNEQVGDEKIERLIHLLERVEDKIDGLETRIDYIDRAPQDVEDDDVPF